MEIEVAKIERKLFEYGEDSGKSTLAYAMLEQKNGALSHDLWTDAEMSLEGKDQEAYDRFMELVKRK